VNNRLKEFGLKTTIVEKNIGYELRCADPIPLDMEYTRDLGYAAAKFILSGGNAAMVSMQAGEFVPIPFTQLLDPVTGRATIRLVNIHSERYAIARSYMIRLKREDFHDPHETAKLAATCGVSIERFREEFEYLMTQEPPRLKLDADKGGFIEDEAMGESAVRM
jgi:6-phosphofructokinase 1